MWTVSWWLIDRLLQQRIKIVYFRTICFRSTFVLLALLRTVYINSAWLLTFHDPHCVSSGAENNDVWNMAALTLICEGKLPSAAHCCLPTSLLPLPMVSLCHRPCPEPFGFRTSVARTSRHRHGPLLAPTTQNGPMSNVHASLLAAGSPKPKGKAEADRTDCTTVSVLVARHRQ